MKMYRIISELDKNLRKVMGIGRWCHAQNYTIVQNDSIKQYWIKNAVFVQFINFQFWFYSCHKFQTPFQNFDSDFKFIFKNSNFQYHSCIKGIHWLFNGVFKAVKLFTSGIETPNKVYPCTSCINLEAVRFLSPRLCLFYLPFSNITGLR